MDIDALAKALAEALDDTREVISRHIEAYGENYRAERLAAMRKRLVESEALLAAHQAAPEAATIESQAAEIADLRDAARLNLENYEFQRNKADKATAGLYSVHYALKDAGWHPGRTDDCLADIIKAKAAEFELLRKVATTPSVLTDTQLTKLLKPIAEAIANNCGTVPQLTFPDLFLGVKKLLAVQAVPPFGGVPDGFVLVPIEFVRGFGDLAHNYSLKAEAPDYYQGIERGAFSDAYARCGIDLAKLRAMLQATPPAHAASEAGTD